MLIPRHAWLSRPLELCDLIARIFQIPKFNFQLPELSFLFCHSLV